MTIDYFIVVVIGCVVIAAVYGYRALSQTKSPNEKTPEDLAIELRHIKREVKELRLETTRNRNLIDKHEKSLEAVKLRQDQADLWFGSIIRHSRAQFDRQAVENFLNEQGMSEEE